jgi:hypothetical protein
MHLIVEQILRITPLVFSLLLDILPFDYLDKWQETANQIDDSELTFDSEAPEGHYKQISVYVFDKLRSSYTVSLALFYTAVLYATAVLNEPSQHIDAMYLIVAVIFFGLAAVSFIIVRDWFTVEDRSPSRYYMYYFEKRGGDQDQVKSQFKSFSRDSIDRWFSPRRGSILVQVILISVVIVLDQVGGKPSLAFALFSATLITLYGFLVYPHSRTMAI